MNNFFTLISGISIGLTAGSFFFVSSLISKDREINQLKSTLHSLETELKSVVEEFVALKVMGEWARLEEQPLDEHGTETRN